ncbi:hypothetical protein JKF63_03154 [Porcisia hertigi]|uniref:Uncharacterized protein n=1 Tax=Porcisia hertigi TaxID=2761500 RepID=A0A836IMV7_9TRYP|nr:hypothetical protein JKF63_03154 [Porcisia hertigi]
MEGSRKYEDAAVRGITRHHVWKSRTSDLTVINLRDPTEVLRIWEPPAVSPVAETKQAIAAPLPPARPQTAKQEGLNALLAKLQLSRSSQESLSLAPHPLSNSVHSALPSGTERPALPSTARVPPPAAAPSPTVVNPEASDPLFPDPKESSPSASGQFEFITGTNIPGQGVVKSTEAMDESSSMALFHDPLWGGALDAFTMLPSSKPSPKPQLHASLSELYASAASNSANAFASPPAPVPQPVPQPQLVASPPLPTVTASPMPTAMAHSIMPMMGGLVQASSPPQINTQYPMYTMPVQYMTQQPQFPTGMVYNVSHFFPYGATPMMLAQPQHIPPGYAIPAAAMMRPGTNVKAMPFVPGNTM